MGPLLLPSGVFPLLLRFYCEPPPLSGVFLFRNLSVFKSFMAAVSSHNPVFTRSLSYLKVFKWAPPLYKAHTCAFESKWALCIYGALLIRTVSFYFLAIPLYLICCSGRSAFSFSVIFSHLQILKEKTGCRIGIPEFRIPVYPGPFHSFNKTPLKMRKEVQIQDLKK